MRKLNEAVLQVGDIILTTTTDVVSKGIRKVTKSDISHALVYVESHSVIDATGDGVHSRNTQRLYWEDACAVHVLRLIEELSAPQTRSIVNYVRGKIGTRYSKTEAARSVIGGKRHPNRRQFCSRLVSQAYASAGINLVESPDYCTPEQLKSSPRLRAVHDAVQNIDNEEIKIWQGIHDTPQSMRDATNALLSGARIKNAEIENISDIDHHLQMTPSDDLYFSDLYERSGYLNVWVAEYEKNRWQYDLKAMIDAPLTNESKRQYCENLLGDDEEGLVRFEVNRAGYTLLVEEFPLETFHLLKTLYKKLVEMHVKRRQTAAQWLSHQYSTELTAKNSAVLFTPHTSEWFTALAAWNPQQAAHTRSILQESKNHYVCSVCGDEPTRDYRLVGPGIPHGAICTLRLCNDCWRIRASMYGESLALLT
ncbi:MAG: YiiX/YebB-like N1pC/P60 family cysteine hydrolase [Geobacteraceae bacterium]|nr:YiiX/YebB-like N1pC/P60 family cysteine hydrolase [Geobacteraceae bacterium]